MGLRWGNATTDRVTWGVGGTAGASATNFLVTGWWHPTTLTATRKLWGLGATIGAEIDATTSELRLRSDNTTDGQWTTTGAGLVANEWKFVAVFGTFNNTGPAGNWRVWVGTVDTPPSGSITPAVATAPAGNFTGNATFAVGNAQTTNNVAFQGYIGDITTLFTTGSGVANTHPLFVAGGTAPSADQERQIFERYVLPAWQNGTFLPQLNWGFASTPTVFAHYWPGLDVSATSTHSSTFNRTSSGVVVPTAVTVSGVLSEATALTAPRGGHQFMNSRVRRT